MTWDLLYLAGAVLLGLLAFKIALGIIKRILYVVVAALIYKSGYAHALIAMILGA